MTIAWRRVDDLPAEPETLPWLYGVARNVMSNNRRALRRQDRLAARLRSELIEHVEEIDSAEPAHARHVQEAMNVLSRIEREVLTLTAAEQLSPAEISTVLGMNQNTVRTHLHRARTKVRQKLAGTDRAEMKRPAPIGHEGAERSSLRFAGPEGAP